MRDMTNALRVNYLFYKDFSRYLKKEKLKHMGGISYATGAILTKIRDHVLTSKDVQLLLDFNNEHITRNVLRNTSVSLKLKYKYLLKKKLFTPKYISQLIGSIKNGASKTIHTNKASQDTLSMFKTHLLERLNYFFINHIPLDINELSVLDILYDGCHITLIKDLPNLPFIHYALIKGCVADNYRSWRVNLKEKELVKQLPSTTILEHLKNFIDDDKNTQTYNSIIAVLEYIDENDDEDYLNKLTPLWPYILEVIKTITCDPDELSSQIRKLLHRLVTLLAKQLITHKYVLTILNTVKVTPRNGEDNLVAFLVECIQQNKEVGNENN